MNNFIIWLDSEQASIFALKPTGIEKSHAKKTIQMHHTINKKDQHQDPDIELFFKELSEKLKGADQILIFGPSMTKKHFQTYLETHHASTLGKNIIGVENLEHVSENQIMAASHKFFKHYDLFNNPI
ncbi:MAG: hypothetical protein H7256_09215 [Bdellovibrio sp.]|nr:hypothetical protein [Bdellovibrio sp.]